MGTFTELYDSAKKGELILIDGGICQYHLRRDGQITIHSIISISPGAGSKMFKMLLKEAKQKKAFCLVAKCPSNLESNKWYKKKGFKKTTTEKLKSGTIINVWHLPLRKKGFL